MKTGKEMESRCSGVLRTEMKKSQPANDVLVTDYCAIKWRKEFECNVTADAFIEYLITKFFHKTIRVEYGCSVFYNSILNGELE